MNSALCVWLSQEVASTSLTQLCSRLEASTGVLISPEGLNQRFNPAGVAFLRIFLRTKIIVRTNGRASRAAHVARKVTRKM